MTNAELIHSINFEWTIIGIPCRIPTTLILGERYRRMNRKKLIDFIQKMNRIYFIYLDDTSIDRISNVISQFDSD